MAAIPATSCKVHLRRVLPDHWKNSSRRASRNAHVPFAHDPAPPIAEMEKLAASRVVCLYPQRTKTSTLILEQGGRLATGKLNLVFNLRGDAVAGRRSKSPQSNRVQNTAIARRASALQDQRAVHTSIGPDDEANFHPAVISLRHNKRIGRGQGFWRLHIFTARRCAGVRHAVELGGVTGWVHTCRSFKPGL